MHLSAISFLLVALLVIVTATAAEEYSLNGTLMLSSRAKFNNNCKCGKKFSMQRIVGGSVTSVNEYPWQAAITTASGAQYCGGSLITNKHILTAAHCFEGEIISNVFVKLRDHDLSTTSETNEITVGVKKIIMHAKYDFPRNDIAILELKTTVPISSKLSPVCLPSNKRTTYARKTATATGWGKTAYGGTSSASLREVDVSVLTNAQCKNIITFPNTIFPTVLCAGAAGKNICFGDSGGPLMYKAGSKYQQIGITSFTIRCGSEGYPGGYTRVNKYLKWIRKMTRRGVYCR